MQKNGGVQVARAIAALSVAYFHSYMALYRFPEASQIPITFLKDWGFLGVNFFFAISGYVICLIASKSHFSTRSFLLKRIFRLYPMYWVAMAFIACMIALGRYRPESLSHILYSMTLLPQEAPVYDPSWTLEREIVFYALAAVSIPIAGVWGLAALLAALAYFGFLLGNPWSFHIVSTAQADFLAGVLVFLITSRLRFGNALSAALICAGSVLLWYTRTTDFPFAATLSLFLILLGMVKLNLPWHRQPLRWLVQIGDASYSIYLLHWIVFRLMWPASHILGIPSWLCEAWRFGSIALCIALSGLTWRFIEQPMIAMGNRLSSAWAAKRYVAMRQAP